MVGAVLAWAAVFGMGCATAAPGSLGGLLAKRQVVTTNQVPVVVVSEQAIPVVQADGVVRTNYLTLTNYEARTVYVTNTVWQASTGAQDVLTTVNAAAPFIPAPFGQFVGFGASLAALALGAIAKRKNDQNASLATQLEAVVRGVEKASAVLPEGSQLKKTIAGVAEKLDVGAALDRTVQELT